MRRSELTEFAVEEEGFKLKIRRGTNGLPVVTAGSRGSASPFPVVTEPVAGLAGTASMPAPISAGMATPPAATEDEPGVAYIKSPMVGTFYRSPSPESKVFVEPGD